MLPCYVVCGAVPCRAVPLRYNEKTDVHSFAVVLWELVTGWLPYAGLSPDQFMFQAVQVNQEQQQQQQQSVGRACMFCCMFGPFSW